MSTGRDQASAEYLLLDLTQRLGKSPAGWRAAVIHLSRLRPDNRRLHNIRIAANTFEALVKQYEGQIFLLQRGDIVFVCKEADAAAVDEAVTRVRYLFGDDPLTADIDSGEGDGFASWYELRRDYAGFAALAEQAYKDEAKRQKRLSGSVGEPPRTERLPMEPQALGELVNAIQRADLSNVLRRQAVCAIAPDETPKPIFREIYISIGDLRDAIMPKRDIASDRWLFKYLTQTLDKRVLALLRRHEDSALAHSYSLNLNVSTLLSPEFLAFDANLRAGARGSIVIEVEKMEIFADLGAYLFARDFVRERGYRVCLDGVTALTLPFIDRERLSLDLVKVFWTPDLAEPGRVERLADFRAAVERVGKARIIFARCDTPEAIEFGQALGVRLFQGRYVDRLLAAAAPRAAAAAPVAAR